jgi:hypothetical protein
MSMGGYAGEYFALLRMAQEKAQSPKAKGNWKREIR